MRRAWSPSSAASLHLTLKFLGVTDVPPAEIAQAVQAAAAMPSFLVTLKGIGAFPRPAKAKVLWVGVDKGAAALVELAQRVDAACHALGFDREARPFVPHITLARTGRSSPGEAVDTVVNDSEVIGAMDVRSVTLFRSDLGPGGAKYVPLAEILLAAGR